MEIPLEHVIGLSALLFAIGTVGALRYYRGVNETIASLLMAYIAIALMNHLVEGPLRDPLSPPTAFGLPPSCTIRAWPPYRRATMPGRPCRSRRRSWLSRKVIRASSLPAKTALSRTSTTTRTSCNQ